MEIIQGSLGSNKKYLLYHCGVIDISRPHPADSAALPSGMSPNGQLEEGKVFVWILLIYMWSLPLNFLVVSPKPSAADCKKRKEKKRKILKARLRILWVWGLWGLRFHLSLRLPFASPDMGCSIGWDLLLRLCFVAGFYKGMAETRPSFPTHTSPRGVERPPGRWNTLLFLPIAWTDGILGLWSDDSLASPLYLCVQVWRGGTLQPLGTNRTDVCFPLAGRMKTGILPEAIWNKPELISGSVASWGALSPLECHQDQVLPAPGLLSVNLHTDLRFWVRVSTVHTRLVFHSHCKEELLYLHSEER